MLTISDRLVLWSDFCQMSDLRILKMTSLDLLVTLYVNYVTAKHIDYKTYIKTTYIVHFCLHILYKTNLQLVFQLTANT